MKITSTRILPGYYKVEDSLGNTVNVEYMDHLKGWMAIAQWTRTLYTDPLDTKREAIHNARHMLTEMVS